eukprot:5443372-Heterocapsa_arctica.AAC.1
MPSGLRTESSEVRAVPACDAGVAMQNGWRGVEGPSEDADGAGVAGVGSCRRSPARRCQVGTVAVPRGWDAARVKRRGGGSP